MYYFTGISTAVVTAITEAREAVNRVVDNVGKFWIHFAIFEDFENAYADTSLPMRVAMLEWIVENEDDEFITTIFNWLERFGLEDEYDQVARQMYVWYLRKQHSNHDDARQAMIMEIEHELRRLNRQSPEIVAQMVSDRFQNHPDASQAFRAAAVWVDLMYADEMTGHTIVIGHFLGDLEIYGLDDAHTEWLTDRVNHHCGLVAQQ